MTADAGAIPPQDDPESVDASGAADAAASAVGGFVQALVLKDAGADVGSIARAAAEFLRTNFSERVVGAAWVTARGSRDRGFELELYRLKTGALAELRPRLGALLGADTAGLDVALDVWRSPAGYTAGIGLGAVLHYNDLAPRHVEAALVGTFRF